MTNHRSTPYLFACSLFACLTTLVGCHDAPPEQSGPGGPQGAVPVQVATATQQDVPVTSTWVATTDGFVNAQIQPQVSGYILRQDYAEGSQVHKGQVLFEIDPRPYEAILAQAKGQLQQARGNVTQQQAQVELQEINVKRDTPLAAERAIAQSQLDNDLKTAQAGKAAVGSAQAGVAAAEAQVQAAALNVGFTRVRSLIDGVAGQAQVQVGNLVSTGSVLTQVSQLNPIKVFFSISEQEYLTLAARARATGHTDLLTSGSALPLKLMLSNNQAYPQQGHIIFVDRSISAQTGSLRVAASFPNPGNLLRPGQFARISANTDVLQNAILVPQRAVGDLQGQSQVFVVGADDIAHVRTVQLGPQIGSNVVIKSGLRGGEHVVTEGNDKMREGAKVQPSADNPPPAQPGTGQAPEGN